MAKHDFAPLIVEETFNDGLLRQAVEGVEDNIWINALDNIEGWGWDSVRDIMELYCDGAEDVDVEEVLSRAIDSRGATIPDDLRAVQLAVQGQNFSGSWWNRK